MNTTDNQNELLVVVDPDDKVLDYLPRKVVHAQKLLHRTISVSVFNDKGEILLQKRSATKDSNAGKWANAAGGHVTKNKDYEETTSREVEEELGIQPKLTLIKKMIINDPVHTTMTCVYKTFANGPFEFNKEEIDEVKFYSKQNLRTIENQLSESARIVLHLQGMI